MLYDGGMNPGRFTIKLKQGAYWSKSMVFKDPTGDPMDLTGWTAHMQARPYEGAATVWVDLSTENGRIILGGLDGTIVLELLDTVTATIPADDGVYDLFLVPPSGQDVPLLEGEFKVKARVTV